MQRSDNFPACTTVEMACFGDSGDFYVHTGFPVKSAVVIPIRMPKDSEIEVDTSFGLDDGFRIVYSNMPEEVNIIKFSYQAG